MECDLREALRETFPGSWCHQLEKMASLDVEGQEMTANRTPVLQRRGRKATRKNSGKVASPKDGVSRRSTVNEEGSGSSSQHLRAWRKRGSSGSFRSPLKPSLLGNGSSISSLTVSTVQALIDLTKKPTEAFDHV